MGDAREVLQRWAGCRPRGVIFDFNGTLSDDEPLLMRIFTELFEEHLGWRLTPEQYFGRLAGHSDREIVEHVVREAGADRALVDPLLAQRRNRYRDLVVADSPVTQDAEGLVVALAAEVPLAIVTGAQRADVELVLDRSRLSGCFQVLVTVEDVVRGKPDPEGFLLAADLIGVPPGGMLVFEDSVVGAQAAAAAGMACIAVAGTADPTALSAVAGAVVPALGAELLAGVAGRSARFDAGAQGDTGAVGAEEVESTLDGQSGRGVGGALDQHQR